MSDPIIRIENLSKRYTLGRQSQNGARYRTLRDTLSESARNLFQRNGHAAATEEFWALKDVSFEVQPGEVVGIIGRNGAGKSTLLKILSRITEPTEGRIKIKGRVASLLEVGTGFHPELTGRENIFLNGAILGMGRVEIKAKFDEIVAFAEVEKFLDTPVKRYSSGMYVRLAFAVAAHLEPEILVVDEVLAVGDAQFQKKCLGKMEDIADCGRTVLIVSHQLGVVAQLCARAIMLDAGRLIDYGPARKVIEAYLESGMGKAAGFVARAVSETSEMPILSARTSTLAGQAASRFTHEDAIVVTITCRVNRWVTGTEVRLVIRDDRGRTVFTTDAELDPRKAEAAPTISAKAIIPGNFLRPNGYVATLATFVPHQVIFDLINDALTFSVIDAGSKYAASEGMDYGCVFANCDWEISYS